MDGVSDDRPAQKAGLKTGDVILAIGDYQNNSLEGYMQTLGKFKKGDKTTVIITRNGRHFHLRLSFNIFQNQTTTYETCTGYKGYDGWFF